jgi:hypothetical protein
MDMGFSPTQAISGKRNLTHHIWWVWKSREFIGEARESRAEQGIAQKFFSLM